MHDQREGPERGRGGRRISRGARCLPCLLHSRINPEQGGQAKTSCGGEKEKEEFLWWRLNKKVEMGVIKPKEPSLVTLALDRTSVGAEIRDRIPHYFTQTP